MANILEIVVLAQLVFFYEIIKHHAQIRTPDFLQIIVNPGVRFVDLDDAVQINR